MWSFLGSKGEVAGKGEESQENCRMGALGAKNGLKLISAIININAH